MAEFSKNRHISNLINMSCKVSVVLSWQLNTIVVQRLQRKNTFTASSRIRKNECWSNVVRVWS